MDVTLYPPGQAAQSFRPGDFLLTTNDGFLARAIRFGERMRFPREWCWTNHAALVTDEAGSLIEALSHGLTASQADKYQPRQYAHVSPDLTEEERGKVWEWANARYEAKDRYGFVVIGCEALVCLTGTRIRFGISGQQICSGFVASALAEGGQDLGDDPAWMMPAGLAAHYRVPAPVSAPPEIIAAMKTADKIVGNEDTP